VWQLPAVHVHGTELRAASERRHGFAGIEQFRRVQGPLYRVELRQLVLTELQAHLVDLLATDAVLAGDRAAGLDAGDQDVATEALRSLQLVTVVGI
jgi:hypothetical protein